MGFENHKPTMILTGQEFLICKDLIHIAGQVSVKYSFTNPLEQSLTEKEARQIKPLFDLFRLCHSDNTATISRISGEEAAVLAGYQNLALASRYSAE